MSGSSGYHRANITDFTGPNPPFLLTLLRHIWGRRSMNDVATLKQVHSGLMILLSVLTAIIIGLCFLRPSLAVIGTAIFSGLFVYGLGGFVQSRLKALEQQLPDVEIVDTGPVTNTSKPPRSEIIDAEFEDVGPAADGQRS